MSTVYRHIQRRSKPERRKRKRSCPDWTSCSSNFPMPQRGRAWDRNRVIGISQRQVPRPRPRLDGTVWCKAHLLWAIVACCGRSPSLTLLFPHMARSPTWQTGCLCTALLAVIWVRILCWVVLLWTFNNTRTVQSKFWRWMTGKVFW